MDTSPQPIRDLLNRIKFNPVMTIIFVLVIVAFVAFSSFVSNGSSGFLSSSMSSSSFPVYGYVIVALISIFIVSHITGWNIRAAIHGMFSSTPELDIKVFEPKDKPPVPEIRLYPEVFNIPGNNYNYVDAQALCTAYGARLATYDEIEKAYNKGGEWCNYGWSEGQMALFPTQKKTYDVLQGIEGHEHDCGRPGVNGGYIANPGVKFGVNCFGHKPRMTPIEEDLMANEPYYPVTKKDLAMEKRVDYWKGRLKDILVSPFNQKNWSRI